MTTRILVVAVLVAAFAVAPLLWRRRQRAIEAGPADHPPVPVALLGGADRTWVLFTTPWCATCGPVEERLRAADTGVRVVKVDATRQPDVASALAVKSVPTALLADRDGRVQARLVGAAAVDRYVTAVP